MLDIYELVRTVPSNAQKPISGGRLNGKTDINPMWRIKKLTEVFGPCGLGWRYEITDKRLERGENGEIAAFVDINLYYVDTKSSTWSHAIPGTGGSMFVAKEKSGMFTSDECFKMALTDAISVACKALGVGADIYWDKDSTKYDKPVEPPKSATPSNQPKIELISVEQQKVLQSLCGTDEKMNNFKQALKLYGYSKASEIQVKDYKAIQDYIDGTGLPFQL